MKSCYSSMVVLGAAAAAATTMFSRVTMAAVIGPTAAAAAASAVVPPHHHQRSRNAPQQQQVRRRRQLQQDDDFAAQLDEKCLHWEQTRDEFVSGTVAWANPACYTFDFTKFGFYAPDVLPPLNAPYTVRVENGVIVNAPANDPDRAALLLTVPQIHNEYRRNCFQECPSDGAYECFAEYDATLGITTSVSINPVSLIADEETYYQVANFTVVTCSGNTAPRDSNSTNNSSITIIAMEETVDSCPSLDDERLAFNAARTQWESRMLADCYEFQFRRLGNYSTDSPYRSSVDVKVQNSAIVEPTLSLAADQALLLTVDQMYDDIEAACLSCPPTAGLCDVAYSSDGYPMRVQIDNEAYVVRSLQQCFDSDGEEDDYYYDPYGTQPDCAVVATRQAEHNRNIANWTSAPHSCYEMTITSIGLFAPDAPPPLNQPLRIRVVNGSVVSMNASTVFDYAVLTMDQLLQLYANDCYAGCATGDRVASDCSARYNTMLGIVTNLYIDPNSATADEEISYRIQDFATCTPDRRGNTVTTTTTTDGGNTGTNDNGLGYGQPVGGGDNSGATADGAVQSVAEESSATTMATTSLLVLSMLLSCRLH